MEILNFITIFLLSELYSAFFFFLSLSLNLFLIAN
jgi:hypothetical protein